MKYKRNLKILLKYINYWNLVHKIALLVTSCTKNKHFYTAAVIKCSYIYAHMHV